MPEAAFFEAPAKKRVTQAVKTFERETSAELVVSVRRKSGSYAQADLTFGAIVGLAALSLLIFLPQEFAPETMPLEVLLAFALGALACAHIDPLRRLLTPNKTLGENVHNAACSAFMRLRIGRTSGRNGVLVFVSTFERRVEIVCDVGIDPAALGDAWQKGLARVAETVSARLDVEAFAASLEALGPIIGAKMPRQADDVNELPDDVDAA